jgi:c(7)-type cytochrome triheme protein
MRVGVFVLAMLLLFSVLSFASHEPIPDMEHGESITSEAGVPSKVGGGGVLFKVKDAGNVFFSHIFHVETKGLRCTDCHDAIYITTKKTSASTMKEMQMGKSCGACHNGKKAFSVKADCGRCHSR